MNTTIIGGSIAVAANPAAKIITQRDIAKNLGISLRTVNKCLSKGSGYVSAATFHRVHDAAKKMGYVLPSSPEYRQQKEIAREAVRRENYLLTHNFPSREAETKRMEYLREQGYSNSEIARKVGRCVLTVRRRIGSQPEDMTKENIRLGQKNRAAKNAKRRQYTANHTVNTYNGMVAELAEVKAKVVLIEGQVKAMLPKVKEAAKISQVKMIEDISDAPATALQ